MTSVGCHDGVMDLTPFIDGLHRDLVANAAAGSAEVSRAAELLAGSLEASTRLCLLEALSEAAAEITTKLASATVDVRLRGREADLTVTDIGSADETPMTTPMDATSGDLARVTLRIPESLKDAAERAAAAEGISVNSWLVRVVHNALMGGRTGPGPSSSPGGRVGRRVTGFAQA